MSDLRKEFFKVMQEFERIPEGGKIILTKQNSQLVASSSYTWEPLVPQKTPLMLREIETPSDPEKDKKG